MKQNFFFYLIPSISRGAIGIVLIIPVTTYYLDPIDFGIFAILGMISSLIMPLSSTGSSWVLSANYYKQSEDDRKTLLFNILFLDVMLRVFWAVVFLMIAKEVLPIVVNDYEGGYYYYFQLSLIGVILNGLWPTISFTIVLKKKGKAHAFIEMGQYIAGITTTIVCLTFLKLTTVTLFIAPISSGLFSFIAGLAYMRNEITLNISLKWWKEIYRVGMPSIPINSFEAVRKSIDRFFIQTWLNLSQLGIYAHSRSYEGIFTMGTKAFNRTFVPEVVHTFTHNQQPANLKKTLNLWYGLLGIAGLIITFFSYEAIDLLTHGKFTAAAPLVPLWFMLSFFHSFGIPYSQYIILNKKTSFLVYSGIVIGSLSIGVGALLIYNFGIMGAAATAVVSNLIIQVSRRMYARKLGCDLIADKQFISILIVMFGVYLINTLFHLMLIEKILGVIFMSIFISYYYGLMTIIRDNGHKLFSSVLAWKTKNY